MLYGSEQPSHLQINNNNIYYAEVRPSVKTAYPILLEIIYYLRAQQEVAYAKIGDNIRMYFLPTSPLTSYLNITHPSHPIILHVLIYRMLLPSLANSGTNTSDEVTIGQVTVKPIPILVTPRQIGFNQTQQNTNDSTPQPFMLSRVPAIATRTIGVQYMASRCHHACQATSINTVDVACQTKLKMKDMEIFDK